jgi:hypothetical protein
MKPKIVNGCKVTMEDNTPDSATEYLTKSPLKSASVESEEISSWARIHKLQETYEPIKSASTEEHKISSWGRLHSIRS